MSVWVTASQPPISSITAIRTNQTGVTHRKLPSASMLSPHGFGPDHGGSSYSASRTLRTNLPRPPLVAPSLFLLSKRIARCFPYDEPALGELSAVRVLLCHSFDQVNRVCVSEHD